MLLLLRFPQGQDVLDPWLANDEEMDQIGTFDKERNATNLVRAEMTLDDMQFKHMMCVHRLKCATSLRIIATNPRHLCAT